MTEVAKVQTPANARKRRFSCTGEPSLGPTSDDAVAERQLTHRSSGGKAVHSGAFDKVEDVPKMLGKK
jgi:hypothetical protein